uniref:Uncharacterized protein n=1 Tax=Tetranychus urticae TaxID=32264 RepID=T1KGU2_TETUR
MADGPDQSHNQDKMDKHRYQNIWQKIEVYLIQGEIDISSTTMVALSLSNPMQLEVLFHHTKVMDLWKAMVYMELCF